MLYVRADRVDQLQDVFYPGPLADEAAIRRFYQDTTEARTGDPYSGFVENIKQDICVLHIPGIQIHVTSAKARKKSLLLRRMFQPVQLRRLPHTGMAYK